MQRYVKKADDTVKPKMLMLNGDDEIMKHWQHGTNALVIDRKEILSKIKDSPWSLISHCIPQYDKTQRNLEMLGNR